MRIDSPHRSRDELFIELAKSDHLWKSKASVDLAFLRLTPEKLLKRIEGR